LFLEEIFKYNENTALIVDNNSVTYKEIIDFSKVVKKKITQRSLVFLLCKNEEASVLGYISFILNKIVPILLDSSIELNRLQKLIKTYQPNYLWLPNTVANKYNFNNTILEFLGYSLVAINEKKFHHLSKSLALLLTTSGSTGSPKLVRLSYLNLKENTQSISNYLSINSSERPVTLMPMNYSYGLSIINSHLINGATILLTTKSVIQRDFWSFIKKNKATSFSGIPYIFEMLVKLNFFEISLPFIKTITQAGGKLKKEVLSKFAIFSKKNKINFYVMYGQTEASPRMSYLSPEYLIEKLGSIGKPIEGGKFYLIDDSGKIIESDNVSGDLVYEGKNVCMGYATSISDLKKENENKNVLYTGDLAKRDSDGFYYIIGRKKRFVKLFGNRLSLDDIENLIKNITDNCACVGFEGKVLIYVNKKNIEEKVIEYISLITKIHYSAFQVKFIKKIPLTKSGKINYSLL